MTEPCTACGTARHYHLADGRFMCAGCRAKRACRPRLSRLSLAKQGRLLAAFWAGMPACRASKAAEVNVKTAQRHFRRFRAALARASESGPVQPAMHASNRVAEPSKGRSAVFGIQERLHSIRVLMPGEAMRLGGTRNATISWVYAPTPAAAARPNLRQFFRIPASHEVRLWHGRAQISRADGFLEFAAERLKAYRGGYRFAFAAYLKEMAFRFNVRSRPDAWPAFLRAVGADPDLCPPTA